MKPVDAETVTGAPDPPNYPGRVQVSAERAPTDTRAERARRAAVGLSVLVGVVLRWVDLGGTTAGFDESFTGVYSHLPLGRVPSALRADDAHPPLDYLVRHFFGGLGDTVALRAPSPVYACAALLVVTWWMWDRGWFGAAVVAVTAVAPFQLLYAHQARMYALAILCGTVVAACADRWQRDERARWRWIMLAALVVGLFDLAAFLLTAAGLLLVAGRRRDTEAWRWRATVVGGLGAWAVVWGASFLHQAGAQHSTWIPFTSVSSAGDALDGMASLYSEVTVLVVALLVLGGIWLRRQDRPLAWSWLALFAVPFGLAVAIGLRSHFLLPRTMAPSAWAVPVAFAAVVEQARRRSTLWAALAVIVVCVVTLPSIEPSVTFQEGSGPAIEALRARARPGDAVVVAPDYLWPLVTWNLRAPRTSAHVAGLDDPGTFVYVVPGAPFDGRAWVLQPKVVGYAPRGASSCGSATPSHGDYALTCIEVPGQGPAGG